MEIVIDAPGCEKGIEIAVSAGVQACKESGINVCFTGPESEIRACLSREHMNGSGIRIVDTDQQVLMDDPADVIFSEKPRASIVLAAQEVAAGRADAVVSAGHTGATVLAARHYLGLFPGIRRAALCQALPAMDNSQFLLVDAGASISVSPSDLASFAVMGHAAYRLFFNQPEPKIGLLNIGREAGKGSTRLLRSARLIQSLPVRFAGNIEGDQIWMHAADVVVTDGLTGNILLKSSEGLIRYLIHALKQHHDTASKSFSYLLFRIFQD